MPTEELVVMGWGRRNNDPGDRGNLSTTGVFSNIMQQLVVPEVPIAKCKEFTSFGALDVEKEICAGGETGERFTFIILICCVISICLSLSCLLLSFFVVILDGPFKTIFFRYSVISDYSLYA